MSDTRIVAIDAGNGSTIGLLAMAGGKTRRDAFASYRAAVRGDTLGLVNEIEIDYYDFLGERWAVGDDILLSRNAPESEHGSFRYGDDEHAFLIAASLRRLNLPSSDIDLTTFAPPSFYRTARENVLSKLLNRKLIISRRGDTKPREYILKNITILPEGFAAAAPFIVGSRGQAIKSDFWQGNVVIVDGGFWTLDTLVVQNGNLNPENLQSATHNNAGISKNIVDPILADLVAKNPSMQGLPPAYVEFAIRQGIIAGDYVLHYGAKTIDLQPMVEKRSVAFARLVKQILDREFEELRPFRAALLIGGAVPLIESHLIGIYGDKIVTPDRRNETKSIHPVDMNVTGGLRLALMRQAQS